MLNVIRGVNVYMLMRELGVVDGVWLQFNGMFLFNRAFRQWCSILLQYLNNHELRIYTEHPQQFPKTDNEES